MTLLASVASLFCTFSVSAAAPSVAVVPEGTVARVEIISPSVESSDVFTSELQVADDDAAVADAADESADVTPDKLAAASDDADLGQADVCEEDTLPADVIVDAEMLLPADVIVEADMLLPADVVADAVDLLPADVVADVDDSGVDAISETNAEAAALTQASADSGTQIDEQPQEDELAPTAAPSEEPGVKSDAGDSSGDGEAAS